MLALPLSDQISLRVKDFRSNSFCGGHAIERHMNRTSESVKEGASFKRPDPTYTELFGDSAFLSSNPDDIIQYINACLRRRQADVDRWLHHMPLSVESQDFEIDLPEVIGLGYYAGSFKFWELKGIRVVLHRTRTLPCEFFIKTAYPVPDFDHVDDVFDDIAKNIEKGLASF